MAISPGLTFEILQYVMNKGNTERHQIKVGDPLDWGFSRIHKKRSPIHDSISNDHDDLEVEAKQNASNILHL